MRWPDQRRGHGRLRLTSGAWRLLAPSLLHLQRLQRAPGRPDLLLPRWEDLLRQTPRRVPQAPLRGMRRGKSRVARSSVRLTRGEGTRGFPLPAALREVLVYRQEAGEVFHEQIQ